MASELFSMSAVFRDLFKAAFMLSSLKILFRKRNDIGKRFLGGVLNSSELPDPLF